MPLAEPSTLRSNSRPRVLHHMYVIAVAPAAAVLAATRFCQPRLSGHGSVAAIVVVVSAPAARHKSLQHHCSRVQYMHRDAS